MHSTRYKLQKTSSRDQGPKTRGNHIATMDGPKGREKHGQLSKAKIISDHFFIKGLVYDF